jgi:hypothetical protein
MLFCVGLAGCFPAGAGSNGNDGGYGFTAPTLELTVNGVHFGPSAPAAGSTASLQTQRDASGAVLSASFSVNAALSSASAGCQLSFVRYGGGIAALQYTVSSQSGAVTADGQVYAPTGERINTPAGGASCSGAGCDFAALALTALDGQHVAGYFSGTMQADSGAGQADVVCTFWLPLTS